MAQVTEDWTYFNAAVLARAQRKADAIRASQHPPAQLVPPQVILPPIVQGPARPGAPWPGFATPLHTAPANQGTVVPPAPRRADVPGDATIRAVVRWALAGLMVLALIALLAKCAEDQGHPWVPSATGTPPPHPGTNAVVTNYTQFNQVAFKDFRVVTGWRFNHSGDRTPDHQYCYIEDGAPGGSKRWDLEIRPGSRFPHPDLLIPGLSKADWEEATSNCHWAN